MLKKLYRPTVLTLAGLAVTIAAISGTTGYVLGRAPSLPRVLAVHFDENAIADRFVMASYTIILVPVWIQLTLAIVFFAIAAMLLYRAEAIRRPVEDELSRQERERLLVTAEAVSLLSAIWVSFQGLLAIRLIMMWQRMCCGLGAIYYQALVVCIVASVIVSIRAAVYVKHPRPLKRTTSEEHWKMWGVYFNRRDPAVFVPLRSGVGWTLNFGRPQAVVFVVLFIFFSIWAPVVILDVLLGE